MSMSMMKESTSTSSTSSTSVDSSLWFVAVATRTHNETGYWGQVDAIHQFCEPHYATSPYLAESYNAISSQIFCVIGLYFLQKLILLMRQRKQQQKQHKQFSNNNNNYELLWFPIVSSIWLIIIGIGSFLFHGTMRRSMQLLDEFPMVGFMLTNILGKIDIHPLTSGNFSFIHKVWILLLHISVLYAYVYLDSYELFVHGFTFLGFIDYILSYSFLYYDFDSSNSKGVVVVGNDNNNQKMSASSSSSSSIVVVDENFINQTKLYSKLSLLTITIGKIAWEIENRCCEFYQHIVWPLHVVWHILSCIAAYYQISFNTNIILIYYNTVNTNNNSVVDNDHNNNETTSSSNKADVMMMVVNNNNINNNMKKVD